MEGRGRHRERQWTAELAGMKVNVVGVKVGTINAYGHYSYKY